MTKIVQIFKRKSKEVPLNLNDRMAACTDDELLKVLKKRIYYTEEAARIAIEEAKRRGLINSEYDLLSDKFRAEELEFSWFPLPEREGARQRIRKSIGRSLVICGIIPIVFGFLEINSGSVGFGRIILAFGIVWGVLSTQFARAYQKLLFYSLMVANAMAFVFVCSRVFKMKTPVILDFFVALTVFLMIAYGLFYIRRIELSNES